MFEVKGIKAVHAIVTDECRTNRGDINAGKTAVSRLADEYDQLIKWHKNTDGVRFHFILAVEILNPDRHPTEAANNQTDGEGNAL